MVAAWAHLINKIGVAFSRWCQNANLQISIIHTLKPCLWILRAVCSNTRGRNAAARHAKARHGTQCTGHTCIPENHYFVYGSNWLSINYLAGQVLLLSICSPACYVACCRKYELNKRRELSCSPGEKGIVLKGTQYILTRGKRKTRQGQKRNRRREWFCSAVRPSRGA